MKSWYLPIIFAVVLGTFIAYVAVPALPPPNPLVYGGFLTMLGWLLKEIAVANKKHKEEQHQKESQSEEEGSDEHA